MRHLKYEWSLRTNQLHKVRYGFDFNHAHQIDWEYVYFCGFRDSPCNGELWQTMCAPLANKYKYLQDTTDSPKVTDLIHTVIAIKSSKLRVKSMRNTTNQEKKLWQAHNPGQQEYIIHFNNAAVEAKLQHDIQVSPYIPLPMFLDKF